MASVLPLKTATATFANQFIMSNLHGKLGQTVLRVRYGKPLLLSTLAPGTFNYLLLYVGITYLYSNEGKD